MTGPLNAPPAGPPAGTPQEGGQPSQGGQGGQGGSTDPNAGQGAQQGNQGQQGGQNGQGGDQRPPWEREGVAFDPESAWRLVQNLRGERDGLKTERDTLGSKVTEAERAQMTEIDRAKSDATTATQRAEAAEAALARFEVATEKGIPANAVAYLQGSTKEELAASADGLLAMLAPAGDQGGQRPPGGRPAERLAPPPPGGSDPNAPAVELDPLKLAGMVPRGF